MRSWWPAVVLGLLWATILFASYRACQRRAALEKRPVVEEGELELRFPSSVWECQFYLNDFPLEIMGRKDVGKVDICMNEIADEDIDFVMDWLAKEYGIEE